MLSHRYVTLLLQLGKPKLKEKKRHLLGSSEWHGCPNLGQGDNKQNLRLSEGRGVAEVHTGAPLGGGW